MPTHFLLETDTSHTSPCPYQLLYESNSCPCVITGMAGFFSIVAYRLYKMKQNRGNTKVSVYLIQMRVMAQGFAVGCMTLGTYLSVPYHHILKRIGIALLFHTNYLIRVTKGVQGYHFSQCNLTV